MHLKNTKIKCLQQKCFYHLNRVELYTVCAQTTSAQLSSPAHVLSERVQVICMNLCFPLNPLTCLLLLYGKV